MQKSQEDPERVNTLENKSLEATSINQNFPQQIPKKHPSQQIWNNLDLPNPFFLDVSSCPMASLKAAPRTRPLPPYTATQRSSHRRICKPESVAAAMGVR
jgi:hypothetical protein